MVTLVSDRTWSQIGGESACNESPTYRSTERVNTVNITVVTVIVVVVARQLHLSIVYSIRRVARSRRQKLSDGHQH